MRKTILIVDDEADIRNLVREILEDEGYATLVAGNSKEAYAVLDAQKPDLAVLDIWLQDSRHDGLQILQTIKSEGSRHIMMPVIMISGHGTIETAVSAIKQGAYDFIEKPFKSDRLLLMVRRGLETASLRRENAALKSQSKLSVDVVGTSNFSKTLRERIQALAMVNSRLLISGALGIGKKTAARMIHDLSKKSGEPFLIYRCGSNEPMIDVFLQAQSGTILLDEVSALSAEQQKVLLGVLQDKQYQARVIATTKQDLQALIEAERFNRNLYQRLAVEAVYMPALSERKQDIAAFYDVFATENAKKLGFSTKPELSIDALRVMEQYAWSGNLHEFQAVVLWVLVHNGSKAVVEASVLPFHSQHGVVDESNNVETFQKPHKMLEQLILELPLREAREVFEREYLTSQVERFDGNISQTAQFIGMERSALHRKIKSLQEKGDHAAEPSQKAATSV